MNPTNGIMGQINNINAMHQGFARPLAMVAPAASSMSQPQQQPGLMQMAQRFLKGTGGGIYNKGGVKSIGGRIGGVGGSLGVDHGKPFGSANINGKSIGSFGPQGY